MQRVTDATLQFDHPVDRDVGADGAFIMGHGMGDLQYAAIDPRTACPGERRCSSSTWSTRSAVDRRTPCHGRGQFPHEHQPLFLAAGVLATQMVNRCLALPLMVRVVCGNAESSSSGAVWVWPASAYSEQRMHTRRHSGSQQFQRGGIAPCAASTVTGKLDAAGKSNRLTTMRPLPASALAGVTQKPAPSIRHAREPLPASGRCDSWSSVHLSSPALRRPARRLPGPSGWSAVPCPRRLRARRGRRTPAAAPCRRAPARETHTQAAAIRPRLAAAFQLRILPVQVEVQGATDPCAHVAGAISQAGAAAGARARVGQPRGRIGAVRRHLDHRLRGSCLGSPCDQKCRQQSN